METTEKMLTDPNITIIETKYINGFKVIICEQKLDEIERKVQNAKATLQLQKCMSKG